MRRKSGIRFSILLFLTLALAVPEYSGAMKFITPADFPPPGGTLALTEDTTLQIGTEEVVRLDFTITVSGNANFIIENDGRLEMGSFYLKVYGGTVAVNNRSIAQGYSWDILDQYDGTQVSNAGSITLSALNLSANGGFGLIELQNGGAMRLGALNGNANYGGHIIIDTRNGSICTGSLTLNAQGWSHGVQSQIDVLGTIWDHCQVLFLPLILRNP